VDARRFCAFDTASAPEAPFVLVRFFRPHNKSAARERMLRAALLGANF
jgi:hypothetical protein